MQILVIEDEESVRANILTILQFEDYEVIGAQNGLLGVELAKKYIPDLIICDIMMPEMDGYGVLHSLREDLVTQTIPFIFLTAKADRPDFRHGMELGADDYLTKPFTRDELLSAIKIRAEKCEKVRKNSERKIDELKSNLSQSLPHEFRTPLTGILGLSEILISDYESIDRSEIFEIAKELNECGVRLNRLIQNFLLYAELEAKASGLSKKTIPCNVISPKELIKHMAVKKARDYEREDDLILEIQDMNIHMVEASFSKIIEELLDNAFKFSRKGTPVNIITVYNKNRFNLYIIDKGRGMTVKQIKEVSAYVQFDRKIYEQQGLGLGLSISRRLVEQLNGTLKIESTPDEQTTVHVSIPMIDE